MSNKSQVSSEKEVKLRIQTKVRQSAAEKFIDECKATRRKPDQLLKLIFEDRYATQ